MDVVWFSWQCPPRNGIMWTYHGWEEEALSHFFKHRLLLLGLFMNESVVSLDSACCQTRNKQLEHGHTRN